MDVLLSAVASDFISRFISSVITKYQKQATTKKLERLQRLLLRARTVVEEADGRLITNQGMLLQLNQLREDMYRGYYVLDTFQIHAAHPERRLKVSQPFNVDRLQSILENLEATIEDMKEFVILLTNCTRVSRQPYSTYLILETCMFGRHMEKEQIINFLLQPCTSLDVLPITGPRYIGKRTLVEHVCNEERVQKIFPQMVHFTGNNLSNTGNDDPIEHQRSLIVVELVHDADEVLWRRCYPSISKKYRGSKIIIISKMEQVSNLGTVQALRLKRLNQHEYWYFFNVLAFGGANSEERPKLAGIANKIATTMDGSFMAANLFTRLLRDNLNAQFWHRVL